MAEEEEDETESTLKLKLLDGQDLKPTNFLKKMKTFILVWIDPRSKKSTKTLTTTTTRNPTWNHDLSFPITLQTLQNPSSCITFQIISPSSPFQPRKVIGSAIMSLSDVRFEEQVFTLQLWRPSGRAHGLIRVSAKIEVNLGFYGPPSGCVTGIPVEMNLGQSQPSVVPSAPSEEDLVGAPQLENDLVERVELLPVDLDRRDKVESECDCASSCDSAAAGDVPSEGSNALRSLLVGFLGGAVAVATVLVGSASNS